MVRRKFDVTESSTILESDILPSKWRIVKNASALSVAIMLYLSASLPCSELQSSINIIDGLGVYSGTVSQLVGIFASFTIPSLVVNKFGLKYTIVFALTTHTLNYFANMYPTWGTMISTGVITSITGAAIWPSKATYLIILSEQYSRAYNTNLSSTVSLMFGFFYSFYYFGYIWGNVASYFILLPPASFHPPLPNQTEKCGLHFCDKDAFDEGNTNFIRPKDTEIYILFGVFILMTWLGALVVGLFMDPLKVPKKEDSVCYLASNTLIHIKRPSHLVMLPMSVLRGFSGTFLSTEYTKAFVACSWGIHNIGLVMVSFGLVCGIMSLVLGKLVRYTGRVPLFTFALTAQVGVAVIVSLWKPNTDEIYLFYLVPVLLGYSNSVWESQVAAFVLALYALVFPNDREIIFSIYAIAENVGGTISRSYSATVCIEYKLLIYMIVVGMGYASYLVTEFKFVKKNKNQLSEPVLKFNSDIK